VPGAPGRSAAVFQLPLRFIDPARGRLKNPRTRVDKRPSAFPGVPTIRCVHVRRALLLFAIVLGLAALAASLSRPSDDEPDRPPDKAGTTTTDTTPQASPGEQETTDVADNSATIELDAADDETRRLEAGRSASVEVAVKEPGQVTIPKLGLTGSADPLTPARFYVLVTAAGRFPIEFIPAGSDESRAAGTLVVTPQKG
jgi:hypothetical protein